MSEASKSAIIIGASSGVGRALAEELAKKNYNLVLLARGQRDLAAIARDLSLRFGVKVKFIEKEIGRDSDYDAIVRECIDNKDGQIEEVFFPIGLVSDKDQKIPDPGPIQSLVYTNFISVAELVIRFANYFKKNTLSGNLVVFSSIATFAPRKKNIIYASSKCALNFFSKGLQHSLPPSISLQVYALGYVDTMMSYGKRLLLPATTPYRVARHIAANLKKGSRFRYYPRYWTFIAEAGRFLPSFIIKRLSV